MKKLLVLILLCLAINIVVAEDAADINANPNSRDNYYSSGFFLGANFGQARGYPKNIPNTGKRVAGLTGRAYIGYNASHYVALDLGYTLLPTIKFSNASIDRIRVVGVDANAIFKFPLGEGFAMYGKVGGIMLRAKGDGPNYSQSQNATTLTYGGGLDYVFANIGGLHTTIDYEHIDGKSGNNFATPTYELVTLGVYYQF